MDRKTSQPQQARAHIAKLLADVAVTKAREGQTKGLLYGMQLAKYPTIITIDADLENDPAHIPNLIQQTAKFNIVVARHTELPRISEIASKTLGKLLGVTDTLSNFRVFRKETVPKRARALIQLERRKNVWC
jgi:hypothetical protein